MTTFLGADPGKLGGIGMIYPDGTYNAVMMPDTCQQLYRLLSGYPGATIAIEKVAARPGQGVTSMFTFGRGYGELIGVATSLGMTILNPTPQAWKKVMLAGTDKGKDAAIQMAEFMFPEINLIPPGCRVVKDGMAEAILLAAYAQKECK